MSEYSSLFVPQYNNTYTCYKTLEPSTVTPQYVTFTFDISYTIDSIHIVTPEDICLADNIFDVELLTNSKPK